MSPSPTPWALLNQFVELGWHRTGSAVDESTARWVADILQAEGFDTEIRRVDLPVWRGSGNVSINGRDVEHLAVPGEWTGRVASSRILAMGLEVHSGGFPAVLDEPVRRAREGAHEAVVVATRHPKGAMVGINRPLAATPSDVPIFLVAGSLEAELDGAEVTVDYESTIEPGATWNVIAYRPGRRRTLMLTTPLNGWFGCAGERGTGLVVLIDVLRRLSDLDVEVVLTGGHELGYVGAERFLQRLPSDHGYRGIFHIGASVAVEAAVEDGTRHLIPTRTAMCSASSDDASAIGDCLRDAELDVRFSNENWIGEGTVWSRVGCPLVSVTGAGVDFHTPGDLPDAVTSPEALARVGHAFARAVEAFSQMVGDGSR